MSHKESTGLTLTQNFLIRNFYRNNTTAAKTSTRGNLSTSQLSYEDALALRRAAKKLGSYSYSDGEDDETIRNTVKAYVETYNNALSTAEETGDSSLKRAAKQLKQLTSKYSEDLKDIGITAGSDGKLSITEGLLKEVDMNKIKEAFHSENNFMKQIGTKSKRLASQANNFIYSQLTGNGSHINLNL